jgi:hypothetical protein
MFCSHCFAEMKALSISNVEHAVNLDKDKDLYKGILPNSSMVRIVAPTKVYAKIIESRLHAIFPAKGMAVQRPLAIIMERTTIQGQSDKALIADSFIQPHPQLDKPFDRFFIKGLLYSGLGNAIAFSFIRPPIWMFWIALFAFAGVYYYYSRKIPILASDRSKLIKKQSLGDSAYERND